MQTETTRQPESDTLPATTRVLDHEAQRLMLVRLVCLVVLAAVFSMGAWSWVGFYQESGGATGLFTQTDFPAVTIASRLVAEGHGSQLYDLNAQLAGQRRLISEGFVALSPLADLKYPYPYTPPIAVLVSPFAGLPPTAGMAIWDLLNIAGMAVGFWYLLCALPLARFTRLALLLGGLTCFPFIVNLEQGQSSGVVMLALGVGFGLMKKGRDFPAGLALGLLALKVQWLPVLLLVLLFKMRWRTLLGIACTGGGLLALSVLVAGTGWISDYLALLARAQQYARELLLDPWYSHSFPGGLTALIGRGTDDVVRTANLVVTVILVGLLLYLWRGKWEPATRRWDGLGAATLLVACFTNWQLNTHDLSLLALPGTLGLSYLAGIAHGSKARLIWLGSLWTLYVATALFLPLGAPIRLTTLLIAVMLAILSFRLIQEHPEKQNALSTA